MATHLPIPTLYTSDDLDPFGRSGRTAHVLGTPAAAPGSGCERG